MLIVCCGMKRSGSTLAFNAARLLASEALDAKSLGFFTTEDIAVSLEKLVRLAYSDEWFILKTHDAVLALESLPESRSVNIFTFRDFRDVAHSGVRIFSWDERQIWEELDLAAIASKRLEAAPNSKCLKYEEFAENHRYLLNSLANFMQLNVSQKAISKIIQSLHKQTTSKEHGSKLNANLRNKIISLYASSQTLKFYARAILPRDLRRAVAYYLRGIDKQSLMHPNHIANRAASDVNLDLRSKVEIRYKNWLSDFGYK